MREMVSLLLAFMQVGLFSFGGGYAVLPMIKEQVVDINGWLTTAEFADVVAISQMTPGPIALNAATFVGLRLGGVWGGVLASIGCVLPSCLIVLVLSGLYLKYRATAAVQGALDGLRPTAAGLIGTAAVSVLLVALFGSDGLPVAFSSLDFLSLSLFAVALFILRRFKQNPVFVMLACGALGVTVYAARELF